MAEQIRSWRGVVERGEVFTAEREVAAMLDLVRAETERVESRFLDPTCGTGNFLLEVLRRKLGVIRARCDGSVGEYRRLVLLALRGMWGVEIQPDTARECRARLRELVEKDARPLLPADELPPFLDDVRRSLEGTIVCGDALALMGAPGAPGPLGGADVDVIVGNPPYQRACACDGRQRSQPVYQHFVRAAKRLAPRYLTMVIPARWYTRAWGLGGFSEEMLHDRHITRLHDFPDGSACFPGVDIKGGICCFLWERDAEGDCLVVSHRGAEPTAVRRPLLEPGADVFLRDERAVPIVRRLLRQGRRSFAELVSAQNPFGLGTSCRGHRHPEEGDVLLVRRDRRTAYVARGKVRRHAEWIDAWKVFVPEAGEGGTPPSKVLGRPLVAGPGTCCTGTFLLVGPFANRQECLNAVSYIQTTAFRYLVSLRKITQHTNARTYAFVPALPLAHPWTDERVGAELGLAPAEHDMMASLVTPLDLGDGCLVVEP